MRRTNKKNFTAIGEPIAIGSLNPDCIGLIIVYFIGANCLRKFIITTTGRLIFDANKLG